MKGRERAILSLETRNNLLRHINLVPGRVQLDWAISSTLSNAETTAIQAPAVFTLSQWVADLSIRLDLLNGYPSPQSADSFQQVALWEKAIEQSFTEIPGPERFALAQKAREAQRLQNQWVDPQDLQHIDNGFHPFNKWCEFVAQQMKERRWVNNEERMRHLVGQLSDQDHSAGLLPQVITLKGFVEFTRLERQLLEALGKCGVEVNIEPPVQLTDTQAVRQGFDSIDQEISAAAKWANSQLALGHTRIGVIVNALPSLAHRIHTVFSNELNPESVLSLSECEGTLFRMSVGFPLSEFDLIRDAMLLLDLASAGMRAPAEFPRVSRLLLSPNWSGGETERFARARLEVLLRRKSGFRLSPAFVSERATRLSGNDELKALVAGINGISVRNPKLKPAEQLLKWLEDWGWPGDASCQPEALKLQSGLIGLLEKLSRQDFASVTDCLLSLKRRCAQEQGPGPGGAFSPIQIMSTDEAYGLSFDAAWHMNFTMENWPARPVSNPFLSGESLKVVPRATEEGAFEYAHRLTTALESCAGEVCFSWCRRLDDLKVSESPLIMHLPDKSEEPVQASCLWRQVSPAASEISDYRSHPWLQEAATEQGVPMTIGSGHRLSSAVSFLNFQSACPLAAYLVFRLDARMEALPQPFTDASYRGELIHAALEELYQVHKGRADQPSIDAVNDAVSRALENCSAEQKLLTVERLAMSNSLREILLEWLGFEDEWAAGVPIETEWRGTFSLGGFEADVRVDRIDRLEDGRIFLVDYKTGYNSQVPGWANERLEDVQLPLYSVLLAGAEIGEPAGVALAFVRPDDMKLIGLSDYLPATGNGVSGFGSRGSKLSRELTGWSEAVALWKTKLEALMNEIRNGDCRHQVFNSDAIRHADLDILLRSEEAKRWVKERSIETN
jgi:exodeoxyribonuclease-5